MGVGVARVECDGGLERAAHLAAQAPGQRLGHADALAVAPDRIGLPVPGVGIAGCRLLLGFGPFGRAQQQVEPGLLPGFDVVGVDTGRLVGQRPAGVTELQTGQRGLFEFAVVKVHPGVQQRRVVGQGLRVALVQPVPMGRQARAVEPVCTGVGAAGPLGHGVSLRRGHAGLL